MNPTIAYRVSAAATSSPVGLVILLYEQMIEDLRRASDAMQARAIERRTREIDHALQIVGYLRASLKREQGGEAGRNLDRFYGLLSKRLLHAQVQVSPEILNEQIAVLLDVREAWLELDRQSNPGRPTAPSLELSLPQAERKTSAEWTS